MPVGFTDGIGIGNEREYPPDDSMLFTLVGILASLLLTITLGATMLAALLFGSTIVAAMEGTLAMHPVNVLAGPAMLPLVVALLIFFSATASLKAEKWGEKIVGEQIRERRHIAAIAHARALRAGVMKQRLDIRQSERNRKHHEPETN